MPKRNSAILEEANLEGIHQDRRVKRRYPLDLPVQYKIMKNYLVIGTGTGTTLDMSSNGIAFATSEPVKVGSYLELSVSWPVLLNQACPLKLVVSGKVVRSDGRVVALRMERHEFRTQGAKAAQSAQLGAGFALGSPSVRAPGAGYRQ
jgi:PilZ domain